MRPASDLSRINRARASSGDNGEEDPPVPISNTEVKLFSAEDTWRETARENRTLPVLVKSKLYMQLAFSVERIWEKWNRFCGSIFSYIIGWKRASYEVKKGYVTTNS